MKVCRTAGDRRALVLGAIFCGLFGIGAGGGWPAAAQTESGESPALTEIVLFGSRPPGDLNPLQYRKEGCQCVEAYLKAASSERRLRMGQASAGPEKQVKARRRNLEGQIAVLLGKNAAREGKEFARAVPLHYEWEGFSEGPLMEAELASQWLDRYPETPLRPFLHLFIAHRLRAGYEAAKRENAEGRLPLLAARYREHLAAAKSSGNPLIACIAADLESQPYVYLSGFGQP
jgi:hypothetical protein